MLAIHKHENQTIKLFDIFHQTLTVMFSLKHHYAKVQMKSIPVIIILSVTDVSYCIYRWQ